MALQLHCPQLKSLAPALSDSLPSLHKMEEILARAIDQVQEVAGPRFAIPALFLSPIAKVNLSVSFNRWITLTIGLVSLYGFYSLLAFSCVGLTGPNEQHTTRSKRLGAVHALPKFIIPTRSIWPQDLLRLATRADCSRAKKVYIPASAVLQDIIQGKLELRSPATDLIDVIKDSLVIDGWNFDFQFNFKDTIVVLQWIIAEELSFGPDLLSKPAKYMELDIIPDAEREVLASFLLSFAGPKFPTGSVHADIMASSRAALVVDDSAIQTQHPPEMADYLCQISVWPSLDFVPRHLTASFIRANQKLLRDDSRPLSVISFTTCERPLALLSKDFKVVAIPLMSRMDPKNDLKSGVLRTSAPLFTQLHGVLAFLTSGPDALNIITTQNTSEQHARELIRYAAKLGRDEGKRAACVEKMGLQGWRAERLYAQWEAALLKNGLLTRWVVLLGKKDRKA